MKDPDSLAERWRPKSRLEKWRASWGRDTRSPWKKWATLGAVFVLLFGFPLGLILSFNPTAMIVGAVVIAVMVAGFWAEPPEA